MKRTERHHLKEDQMARGMNALAGFLKSNRSELIKAGLVLAAVGVVFVILILINNRNEVVQSRVSSEVIALAAELKEKPENLTRLEKLAGGGKYNRLAYIELAKYWMAKGDFTKAEGFLSEFPSGRRDMVYCQAQMLKARLHTMAGDYERAEAVLKEIVDDEPRDFPLDIAMFELAEIYEHQGEADKALELYREIETKYAESSIGYEASQKASRLVLVGN